MACCRWMLFTSPFSGPSRQTAVSELRPFSALNSTKIPPFFPLSPHYRASWGPSSVQLLVLEFLRLPSHDPLSCHHPSLNSSVCGTLLAKSMSVNSATPEEFLLDKYNFLDAELFSPAAPDTSHERHLRRRRKQSRALKPRREGFLECVLVKIRL